MYDIMPIIQLLMLTESISNSASFLRQNNFAEAYQSLNKFEEQRHYSKQYEIDVLLNRSTISFEENKIQQSVNFLNKAIQIEPFDYRLYYNLFAIYCKTKNYTKANIAFKKCISVLYCLLVMNGQTQQTIEYLDRALEIWQQNTAAYVFKAIFYINQKQQQKANQVVSEALQKSLMKHHIFALCCALDSKLNRESQRQKNAKDYHKHLLHRLSLHDHDSLVERNQQDLKKQLAILLKQFNRLIGKCRLGDLRRYQQKPSVLFMDVQYNNKINMEFEISKHLGALDLACIEEKQQAELEEQRQDERKQERVEAVSSNQRASSQQQRGSSASKMKIQQILAGNQKIIRELSGQKKRDSAKILQPIHITQEIKTEQKRKDNPKTESSSKKDVEQNEDSNKRQEKHQIATTNIANKQKSKISDKSIDEHTKLVTNKEQIKQGKTQNKSQIITTASLHNQQGQVKKENMTRSEIKGKQESEHKQQQLKIEHEDHAKHKKDGDGEQLYPRTLPNFEIKLILANLQINQQLFGKMDPYVYYEYGSQKHKTTIAKGQGMNPRWENQVKVFSLQKNPTVMKVSIYDREIFKWDDLVGQTSFEVNKTGLFFLPVYLNDKKSGEIMFHLSKHK